MLRTIAVVFGTRPEVIKLAPVIRELRKYPQKFRTVVIVTGQHQEMLSQMLRTFRIRPDHDLHVMQKGQTLSGLSSRVLMRLEKAFERTRPDMVVVQGDTSTTFLTALAAFYRSIPVAHVEAGLRTGDVRNPFPEEMNRLLSTRLASLHFAPTAGAFKVVAREMRPDAKVFLTGNTVIDSLRMFLGRDDMRPSGRRPHILITAHRRESFGRPLEDICRAIGALAVKYPGIDFIFPVHLNPQVQSTVRRILSRTRSVKLIEPLPYDSFVRVLSTAQCVLTDSGGVQEEAPALGIPAVVLREVTERPEAVKSGAVVCAGTSRQKIITAVSRILDDPAVHARMSRAVSPYGDGLASERIVQAIGYFFGVSAKKPKPFSPGRAKITPSVRIEK